MCHSKLAARGIKQIRGVEKEERTKAKPKTRKRNLILIAKKKANRQREARRTVAAKQARKHQAWIRKERARYLVS